MVKIRGLYQKRGWWYYSRMRQGIRKVIALETRDEQEAVRKALELVDAPELALADSWEAEIKAFIRFKTDRQIFSRFTADSKSYVLKKAANWFKKPVASIKPADIQSFYEEQRKTLRESTAQTYVLALRSFFRWCVEHRKIVAKNPTASIDMGRWDYGSKTKYCRPEIRDALLAGWRNIPANVMPPDQARMIGFVFHAGFESGLRRNEIVEARPNWFNLQGRTVHVHSTTTFRPKDREDRTIPLTDVFIDFLKEYPLNGTWCIAPEVQRGKSRYRYDFIRPFEIYVEHMGKELKQDLSWVTPHIMRHTFGSLLAIAGESLAKISEWMGDDPRVTDRHYLHFKEGDKAINRLHSFTVSQPQAQPLSEPHSPQHKSVSSMQCIDHNQKVSADSLVSEV